jgi:hypothetical protein
MSALQFELAQTASFNVLMVYPFVPTFFNVRVVYIAKYLRTALNKVRGYGQSSSEYSQRLIIL